MKKKDKKKLEDIKNYIANLESKKDITEGDVDELSNLIDKAVNGTKLEKLIKNIFIYVIRFIAIFVTSLLMIGILFNEVSLENKYNIFYVCLITSGVLAFVDFVPFIDKRGFNWIYFILIFIVMLTGIVLNDVIKVFNYNTLWIVYIIFIELFYNLLKIFIARRTLEKMR